MKNIFKKIPSFVLFVVLAVVYVGCGYVVGYHQGYKAGQEDYIAYINRLFDDIKLQTVAPEKTKKD